MEAATVTRTDKEFVGEMIQVVDDTHWIKGALACVHVLYEVDEKGKTKTEEFVKYGQTHQVPLLRVDANGQLMTKPTACLVGIILLVERGGDWGSTRPVSLATARRKMRAAVGESEQIYFPMPTGKTGKTSPRWSEDQLTDQGHRVVALIVRELIRAPAMFKYPGAWATRERRKRQIEDVQPWLAESDSVRLYLEVESWNDEEATSKVLVRKLLQRVYDRLPD